MPSAPPPGHAWGRRRCPPAVLRADGGVWGRCSRSSPRSGPGSVSGPGAFAARFATAITCPCRRRAAALGPVVRAGARAARSSQRPSLERDLRLSRCARPSLKCRPSLGPWRGGTISSLLLAVRDVERHAPMAGCGGVFALVAALRPRLRLRPGGLFDALRHGPRVAVPRPRAGQSFRPDCAQRDKGAVAFARARPPPLFEFYLLTSTFCLLFLSASCTDSQHDFPPRFKTGSGASQSSSSMQGHSHCAKGQDKLTHDFDQVISKEN